MRKEKGYCINKFTKEFMIFFSLKRKLSFQNISLQKYSEVDYSY